MNKLKEFKFRLSGVKSYTTIALYTEYIVYRLSTALSTDHTFDEIKRTSRLIRNSNIPAKYVR